MGFIVIEGDMNGMYPLIMSRYVKIKLLNITTRGHGAGILLNINLQNGSFMGQMLVNISDLEHLGLILGLKGLLIEGLQIETKQDI